MTGGAGYIKRGARAALSFIDTIGLLMGRRPWTTGLLLLAVACAPARPERRLAAASIFPLYDVARRVAGDRTPVELVLPPGQTTHVFDPRPRDVARLADARLVFAVGLGLDGWLGSIVKSAGGDRARIVELGPSVDPLRVPERILMAMGPDHPSGPGSPDPHFWMDPVRMQRATGLMAEALDALDPEGASGYRARSEEVRRSLALLHEEIARRAAGWKRRKIVTFHASMLYFADRYGLEVTAVVEPRPNQEPTPHYLAELLEIVRGEAPAALFSEPQMDPRPARVLAADTGLPLYELDPVGGGPGVDSYEKLLRHDADVLEKALR